MSPKGKSDPKVLRRVAREALERINTLPEAQGRRIVRFLGLLYLRPADCREIERILTIDSARSVPRGGGR